MGLFGKLFSKGKTTATELPPEFLEESPPDWLIDLKGQEMPDGNHFSIRAQLSKAARTGTAEILVLPRADGEAPKSATTELERLEIDKLLVILGFSFLSDFADVGGDMNAGLPVSITIHRLEPYAARSANCNLAGWRGSKQPAPPAVDIGIVLVGARDRALGNRQ